MVDVSSVLRLQEQLHDAHTELEAERASHQAMDNKLRALQTERDSLARSNYTHFTEVNCDSID